MLRIQIWPDPPPMEAGSPLPATRRIRDRLLVAYVCRNPEFPSWDSEAEIDNPGFDAYCAIIEFSGVKRFSLGPPNDTRLWAHPLYRSGLRFYDFHEITDDSDNSFKQWIVTFHDETLDIIADTASVLRAKIDVLIGC